MCQDFSSSEYGNCQDFNPCANAVAMFFHLKVNFEKKSGFFQLRNFRFCSSQKYDDSFFAPSSVKWSLMGGYNQRKISNLRSLTRGDRLQ